MPGIVDRGLKGTHRPLARPASLGLLSQRRRGDVDMLRGFAGGALHTKPGRFHVKQARPSAVGVARSASCDTTRAAHPARGARADNPQFVDDALTDTVSDGGQQGCGEQLQRGGPGRLFGAEGDPAVL